MPFKLRCKGLFALLIAAARLSAAVPVGTDDVASLSVEQLVQVKVQTASLHEQSLESAPAAISVISAEEIRKNGYRTFAEILNHVRGFYTAYDHTYYEVGIAGFALPGDWGTRVLILLNGHPLPDNVFGSSNYLGQDFILDIALIERVEIVRGPSSALYGSNGILATINVITRKAAGGNTTSVRAETATPGDRILSLTQSLKVGQTGSLLLSATAFNNLGDPNIYIADLNATAINMDGQKGYRFYASLDLGNWQIVTMGVARRKIQPISWAPTIFNDPGTSATDARAFIEATYTRNFDSRHVLRWRTAYDQYRYHGDYRYPLGDDNIHSTQIDTNHEFDAGDWISSQLTYRLPSLGGDLTAGAEVKTDLRALQSVADILPVFNQNLYVNKLDAYTAGFVQQEWSFHRRWSFNFGARYDWSKYRSSAVSPRAAIVFQPDRRTSLKLLYGRGFRNPNANELFFSDGKQDIGNPGLKPEQADSIQFAVDRKFLHSWTIGLSAYDMVDRKVIMPTYTPDGLQQFVNGSVFRGWGTGVEVSGKPRAFLEIEGSFQKQQAHLDGVTPANSPAYLARLRGSVPLRQKQYTFTSALLYQSERTTFAGATLPAVYLAEASFVGKARSGAWQFQAGVRNMLNIHYSDPVGLVSTVDTLPQAGRSVFLTVTTNPERPR